MTAPGSSVLPTPTDRAGVEAGAHRVLTNKERMAIERHPMPEQDPERRSHTFDEVNLGYTLQLAAEEAERCILCPAAPCVAGCPVNVNIPGLMKPSTEAHSPPATAA